MDQFDDMPVAADEGFVNVDQQQQEQTPAASAMPDPEPDVEDALT
jgi:hypothetical protein